MAGLTLPAVLVQTHTVYGVKICALVSHSEKVCCFKDAASVCGRNHTLNVKDEHSRYDAFSVSQK